MLIPCTFYWLPLCNLVIYPDFASDSHRGRLQAVKADVSEASTRMACAYT
jgi:hypothetical protein